MDRGLIRAREFIGQSRGPAAASKSSRGPDKASGSTSSSARSDGMNQREQSEALRDFNQGVCNVLVSTSVGEGQWSMRSPSVWSG